MVTLEKSGVYKDFYGMPNISKGYTLTAKSIHDVIIDIAGLYFPLRQLTHQKNMKVEEELGSGSHNPWALTDKEHTYQGSFSFGSFLKNGAPAMNSWQLMALTQLLENQDDEGQPNYFRILTMDRVGEAQGPNYGDFIEALMYCKITKSGRQYPENNTIISEYDFKYMYRLPK